MYQTPRLTAILLLNGWMALFCASLLAQGPSNDLPRMVSELKQKIEADSGLADPDRAQLNAQVQAAEANLSEIEKLKTQIAFHEQQAATAATRSADYVAKLEELKRSQPVPGQETKQPQPGEPSSIPEQVPALTEQEREARLAKLEEQITKIKNEIEALNQTLKSKKEAQEANLKKSADRVNWRQKIQAQLDAVENRLKETQLKLQALPPEDNSLAAQATNVLLLSTQQRDETEKAKLSAEQTHYEKSEQEKVLRYEKELLDAEITLLESQRAELQKRESALIKQKSALVAKQAKEKEVEAVKKYPLLSSSFAVNTDLAKRVGEINERIEEAKRNLSGLENQVKKVREDFADTKTRETTIGPTESIGALLRYRKSELPDLNQLSTDADSFKAQMDEVLFYLFEVDQKRDELSRSTIRKEVVDSKLEDPDQAASRAKINESFDKLLEKPEDESAKEPLKSPVDQLIEDRREWLGNVIDRLEDLSTALDKVIQEENVLIKETKQFREFIDERILWIRSNDLLFTEVTIDNSDKAILQLSSWKGALERAWQTILKNPVVAILAVFVVGLLLVMKPRMRREVDRLGQVASRSSCDTFWPTARALVLTVVIGISIPLIPMFLGLILSDHSASSLFPDVDTAKVTSNAAPADVAIDPTTSELAGDNETLEASSEPEPSDALFNALGSSLIVLAWFAIPFEILRRICRPNGLANEHFDWSDRAVEKLRQQLRQLILPGAVFVFLIALLRYLDQIERTTDVDFIERILFVVAMLGFAYFTWQTFHPKQGIFADYLKGHERSWANQTAVLWFGIIVGIPLSLAILAFLGYYYTAIQLADRAFWTFVFALVVETVRESLKRMILVRRRHVHIEAARRKHELHLQARREQIKAQGAGAAPTIVDSTPELDDLQSDIDENAKQASKLVSLSMALVWAIGLWMIWTDVMPALQALDRVPVWPPETELAMTEPGGESTTPPSSSSSTVNSAMGVPASASTTEATTDSNDALKSITYRDLLVFIVIAILTFISARNLPSALEMVLLEQLPFDRSLRYAIKSVTSYAIVMIGVLLAFQALSIGWNNVQWLATALTFGLAFGLQEIFANFVAGLILMFERPIRIGDLVTVDDFTGTVTKIRTRATTIVNWDRKEYVIPNKDFITGRLVNWTLSDEVNRIVITVGIAYGSDVAKAKSILLDICDRHPKISDEPETSVAFEMFADSALNLTLRTFLDVLEGRLKVIDELHTQINDAFNEAGIVIAFPQRDLNICSLDSQVTQAIRDSRSATTDRNMDQIASETAPEKDETKR